MWYLFLISFTFAFVLGQFARISASPGLNLLAMDAVAVLFASYWLARHLLQKKDIDTTVLIKPVLIFSAFALLSLVLNLSWVGFEKGIVSVLYLVRFLAYFGVFLFVREQSKSNKNLLKNSLLAIMTVAVIIGIFQIFYYPNLRNLFYLGWDDHLYRLFSVFLDPNYTGVLFVLFLIYQVYYFFGLKKSENAKKAFVVLLFALTFLSVFLTYSRTALITLVFSGVFYLALSKRKSLILAFSFIVFLFFMSTINPHVEGLNPFRTASTKARVTSYQIALDIFQKNPVFGVGFNTYRYAQNIYGYRVGGSWETSHADAGTDNSFLLVLATTGITGFSAFMYFLYKLVNYLLKIQKKDNIGKYALVSLISVFIASFFVNALFYPFVLAWIWVLIGLGSSQKQSST